MHFRFEYLEALEDGLNVKIEGISIKDAFPLIIILSFGVVGRGGW